MAHEQSTQRTYSARGATSGGMPTDSTFEDAGKHYAVITDGQHFFAALADFYVSDPGHGVLEGQQYNPNDIGYRPIHPSTTLADVEGATYAWDDGSAWHFSHASPGEQLDYAAEVEAFAFSAFVESVLAAELEPQQNADLSIKTAARYKAKDIKKFARAVGRFAHAYVVNAHLGAFHRDRTQDHRRSITVRSIDAVLADWAETGKTDNAVKLAHTRAQAAATTVRTRLTSTHSIKFRHEHERLRALAGEETGGYEYVYASSTDGAAITGDANLPLATMIFDHPALAGGIIRGTTVIYDGVPPDVSKTRPYIIRFKRPKPADAFQGKNIGSVAWEQESAYRAVAEASE